MSQTSPPAANQPPRTLTDDQAHIAIGAMSRDERRSALKLLAGSAPKDFASAVWYVERHRELDAEAKRCAARRFPSVPGPDHATGQNSAR